MKSLVSTPAAGLKSVGGAVALSRRWSEAHDRSTVRRSKNFCRFFNESSSARQCASVAGTRSLLPARAPDPGQLGRRGGATPRGNIAALASSTRARGATSGAGDSWDSTAGVAASSGASREEEVEDEEEVWADDDEQMQLSEDETEDEELEAVKRALGPEFVVAVEDWDEDELDELFDKFGTTVASVSSESTEAAAGVPLAAQEQQQQQQQLQQGVATVPTSQGLRASDPPTDEESEALALALATAASDTKAGAIRVLDVRPLVYWTQFFVVATAFSRPQMDAMAKRMSDLAEERYGRALRAAERASPGPWTLLDYGDVVVHLFAPRERERYAIEEFYANAREVPLPFPQEQGASP